MVAASGVLDEKRGRLPNILAADFYRSGDLFEVVARLEGVDTRAAETR